MVVSFHPFLFIDPQNSVLRGVRDWVSVSVHPARRSATGITRDSGHHSRVCKVSYSSPALHALWRRAACLWARLTRGPMTQGPWGVLRTRLIDPMTGIRRRCGGRAVAAQCRCDSRPHRSGRAQGPPRTSKVWPSMCSSLRSVTSRTAAVDKARRGATAPSLSASCQ